MAGHGIKLILHSTEMKRSDDGHWVYGTEQVWEVMYRWYNSETSLAEPEQKLLCQVPEGVKFYKSEYFCSEVCRMLNQKENDA